MKNGMKTCKHCGAQMASGAKICPNCGGKNKKPIYQRPWFIVIVALFLVGAVGNSMKDERSTGGTTVSKDTTEVAEEAAEEAAEEVAITYTPYTAQELYDDLQSNALKAADKYKGQYVELTGRLSTIDSSGDYISVLPENEPWAIVCAQCYIKNDDQRAVIMNKAKDDVVVVKGKITDVGEVLGYFLDIDEIQ